MIVRIYKTLWVVGIVLAAGIYLSGSMDPMLRVVFGFLSFGMVFMGMISVLPFTISHPSDNETPKEAPETAAAPSYTHAQTV